MRVRAHVGNLGGPGFLLLVALAHLEEHHFLGLLVKLLEHLAAVIQALLVEQMVQYREEDDGVEAGDRVEKFRRDRVHQEPGSGQIVEDDLVGAGEHPPLIKVDADAEGQPLAGGLDDVIALRAAQIDEAFGASAVQDLLNCSPAYFAGSGPQAVCTISEYGLVDLVTAQVPGVNRLVDSLEVGLYGLALQCMTPGVLRAIPGRGSTAPL